MKNNKDTKNKTGLYIKYKRDGTPYGVMIVGDFPIVKCQEWEGDCKKNFNGIRWVKAMNDHEKAKAFDLLVQQKFDVELDTQMNNEKNEEESVVLSGEKLKI